MNNIIEMKMSDFQTANKDVYRKEVPLIQQVYRSTSSEERQCKSILYDIARDLGSSVNVVRIDSADDAAAEPAGNDETGPLFYTFAMGVMVDNHVGPATRAQLEEMVRKAAERIVVLKRTLKHIVKVNDDTFQSIVLDAKVPVLLDFSAAWCAPCRGMAPLLDELAAELGSDATVAMIDIDENAATKQRYGIQGIPRFMVFANGEPVADHLGTTTRTKLKELLRIGSEKIASSGTAAQ